MTSATGRTTAPRVVGGIGSSPSGPHPPPAGPFAPLLFLGANGWLLGREFFQMAARRHLDEGPASDLRRAHSARVTLTGVLAIQ